MSALTKVQALAAVRRRARASDGAREKLIASMREARDPEQTEEPASLREIAGAAGLSYDTVMRWTAPPTAEPTAEVARLADELVTAASVPGDGGGG